MDCTYQGYHIRSATMQDAPQLTTWWNDGNVMAHAGFPNGTGETLQDVERCIARNLVGIRELLIIEVETCAIGEMVYRKVGALTAEIGIKLCRFEQQNKGHGKVFLRMLLQVLFQTYGYKKVILDTNLTNTRAQHVYEQLGFRKVSVQSAAWIDQLGIPQTSVNYEMCIEEYQNYL